MGGMSGSARPRGVYSLVIFAAILAMVAGPVAHSRTLTPVKCVAKGKFRLDPPEPPGSFRDNSLIAQSFSEVATGSCIGGPEGAYELSLSGDGGRTLTLTYGEDLNPWDEWFMNVKLRLRGATTGSESGRNQLWLGEALVGDAAFVVTQFGGLPVFGIRPPKTVGAGTSRHKKTCGDLCDFVTVNFVFTW
jgi:hypothetical protein